MGKNNVYDRIEELDSAVKDVQLEQRRVAELLNISDNWRTETAKWIGKTICVYLRNDSCILGRLKWIDKYNVAVVKEGARGPSVINKGAINYIEAHPND